jgi:cytochrome P450 PksS
LRVSAPVYRIRNRDGRPLCLVTRYEDILQVLKDPRFVKNRFAVLSPEQRASGPELPPALQLLNRHLLAIDPPEHTRLRTLVNKAFTSKAIEPWRPRIQALADALLDQVQGNGRMDLIDDYAFPLPMSVIVELLGIPPADQILFRQWSNIVINHTCSRLQSSAGLRAIIGLFVLRLFDSIGVAALTLPATGLAIIATCAHLSVLLLTLSATERARKRWFS